MRNHLVGAGTDEVWEYFFTPEYCHGKENNIQPAMTCSKLTIETLEQGVNYVQS